MQVDVSRLIRAWQTGTMKAPGVVDETVDQKALQGRPDRAPSPTPEPSIGDRESSGPTQIVSPERTPMSISGEEPEYEPAEDHKLDVSSGDGEDPMDHLGQAIDRNLSLHGNATSSNPNHSQTRNIGAASAAGIEDTPALGDTPLGRQSELSATTQVSTDLSRRQGLGNKFVDCNTHDRRSQSVSKGVQETTDEARQSGSQGTQEAQSKGEETTKRTVGLNDAHDDDDDNEAGGVPLTPESLDT